MIRELIERELSAAKHAVEALRGSFPHRTTLMKRHEFDWPLDDLGQSLQDLEREPAEPVTGPPEVTGGR